MRKRLLRWALALAAVALPALPSLAQIPDGYYASLKGKKGAELKTAIYNIIKKHKVLSYGSGSNSTWGGFWETDRTDDGYFIDRYSPKSAWVKSTSKGNAGSGMNIEHSFPQSWWGGSDCDLKKDLYNIMPCEAKINGSKSNFGMGVVTNVSTTNGATKIGAGSNGFNVWEPADEWKGDFARGFLYIVTAYQDYQNKWTSESKNSLYNNTYPTLKEWAYKLYIQWAKADKPDQLEIKRNEAVAKIQGNRNPYVDFPNLMEYVWGDSINYEFDPDKTMKSTDYNNEGGGTVNPDPDQPAAGTVISLDFTQGKQDCTETIAKNESTNNSIWLQTSQYGWKASAFVSSTKTNYAADATLAMPEIDLTDYEDATLTLSQAVNFAKGKALQYLSIEATAIDPVDGSKEITKLADFKVPATDGWSFADYKFDLTHFCGSKVTLGFHYTSDATTCCTWEIKKAVVTGTKATTAITTPQTSAGAQGHIDLSKPYDLYTPDGRKLSKGHAGKGLYIIRQGNITRKVIY